MSIDNSTFERVEEFKYLGTTLTNQNSVAEEIKSRLRSGNACYHSVQNLLSSRLLSKNLSITSVLGLVPSLSVTKVIQNVALIIQHRCKDSF